MSFILLVRVFIYCRKKIKIVPSCKFESKCIKWYLLIKREPKHKGFTLFKIQMYIRTDENFIKHFDNILVLSNWRIRHWLGTKLAFYNTLTDFLYCLV